MTTKIEWTHVPDGKGGFKKGETWNVQVGCQEVSAKCRNCYAASTAHLHAKSIPQHAGLTVKRSNGVHWNGKINRVPKLLAQPLRWREPRGVFVGSMTDTFYDVSTDDACRWIAAIFGVMAACPQHTFMLLTKRPENAERWFAWLAAHMRVWLSPQAFVSGEAQSQLPDETPDRIVEKLFPSSTLPWPLPHVWIGVTPDDGDDIDSLRRIPAAVRFLSIEPMLEPVDFDLHSIDWVIAGGESGARARPTRPDWVRSLRDRCQRTSTAFFFKQWGEWGPKQSGPGAGVEPARYGKKLAGRELDGRTWDGFPEVAGGQ